MNGSSPTTIGVIAGAFVGIVAVAFAFAGTWRDPTPPTVAVIAPERAPAGELIEVRITTDEDTTSTLVYGATVVEGTTERDVESVVELPAAPGDVAWQVVVRAKSGLESRTEGRIRGEIVPVGRLIVPARVRIGDPLTVTLDIRPIDAIVDDVRLSVDDRTIDVHGFAGALVGFAAAPLSTDPVPLTFRLAWRDAFGRLHEDAATVFVDARPGDVEDLDVPAATLAVVNDAARTTESEAFASFTIDPGAPPRWQRSFVMPTEGFGSAGFASARRYAPGGPVSFHEGEDVAAPTGTPVRSTNVGTVVLARDLPIKGGTVVVDHGAGVTSRYYHLSAIDVNEGEPVERGQRIGAVGSTGLSTGPHLHFEVRVGSQPTDALVWVDALVPGGPTDRSP